MTGPDVQLDVAAVLDLEAGRVPQVLQDASRGAGDTGRVCAWCEDPLPPGTRADAEVCPKSVDPYGKCRKARHRFRKAIEAGRVPRATRERRPAARPPAGTPLERPARFAYADPPYPGMAGLYPENTEVDHRELIARLERDFPDGWALSTSAAALRDVLPQCPRSVRVCAWRRRVRRSPSKRALSAWEPLLVVGGRALPIDRAQTLLDDLETADVILDELPDEVLDYRGRYDAFPGALVGMKPPEFAVWMFQQLGARAGDELRDLFPGSGAITKAWGFYTSPLEPGERDASAPRPPGTRRDPGGTRPASLEIPGTRPARRHAAGGTERCVA